MSNYEIWVAAWVKEGQFTGVGGFKCGKLLYNYKNRGLAHIYYSVRPQLKIRHDFWSHKFLVDGAQSLQTEK